MSYIISKTELKEFNYSFNNFFINSTDNEVYSTTTEFLLVEGFVYDMKLNKKLAPKEIALLMQEFLSTNQVFPDHITGQYNIVYITDSTINIVNDFVGIKPLYYCFGGEIFISNTIYKFLDYNFEIDETGFFQSMVGNLYIPLNARTLIKKVSLLRGGEYISHELLTSCNKSSIDTMKMTNDKITNQEVLELSYLLKKNANIYASIFDKIVLPLSAGVDSRITLSAFGEFNSKFKTVSYGEAEYIDNKIAKKIAKFIGVEHTNISFKDHLFPSRDEFDQLKANGGEYFISSWFSVIKQLRSTSKFDNSVVLLGDILDTLRAKNLRFLRSRKERFKYQLQRAVGLEKKLEALDLDLFVARTIKFYISEIKALQKLYPALFTKLDFNEKSFIEQTTKDLQNFVEFINLKFSPENQANLEEAFYISTWGCRTMSKQVTIFKGNYQSFVIMASRHVVKHNLKFSPLERFEDRLTHKLLRTKGFNSYSHFSTAQIPFISYSSNIYMKYIFWALRSGIDQLLIAMGKPRLVKHIEWAQYYKRNANKKLLTELLIEVDEDLSKIPIDIFDKRASGEAWPLSEVDINVFSNLFKFRCLKSNS